MPDPARLTPGHPLVPKGKVVLVGIVAWSDLTPDLTELRFRVRLVKSGMKGWGDRPAAERAILDALTDKEWDWRTLRGLERATGLERSVILKFLEQVPHPDGIERMESPEYGTVYRLKSRWRTFIERLFNVLDRVLDYLSLGMRSQNA